MIHENTPRGRMAGHIAATGLPVFLLTVLLNPFETIRYLRKGTLT